MKKIFKEYHQFTKQEFLQLWKNCLFVFDANTLLNMYRYSRTTVDDYFKVLEKLKKRNQLWIPYQVGYEFYENRIDVIYEYEKSYDEILSILKKAKNDIESKYKDHPFLNLSRINKEINTGLSGVESRIKKAKSDHPKWIEKDDVLEKLNQLFKGNVGNNYDNPKLKEIKREGKDRYKKSVPPGFKDANKSKDKKYGDLILWYQLIDKAKKSKKPIILISGDVKEDWWLEKDGKKLMPLPQLKKEMFDKASVDFHIYTADRFLELSKKRKRGKKDIDEKTIKEVRKIRELEEKRMMLRRMEMIEREKEGDLNPKMFRRYSIEYMHLFEILKGLIIRINESEIDPRRKEDLDHLFHRIRRLRNRIVHGETNRLLFDRFYRYTKEILYILDRIIRSEEVDPELSMKIRRYIRRADYFNRKLRRFI